MIQTVIFDMDGVIVDSLGYHWEAWQKTVEELGLTYPKELDAKINGMSMKNSIELINQYANKKVDVKDAVKLKTDNVREYYKNNVELFPGVLKLLEELKKINMNMAIASSSADEFIQMMIKKFNLNIEVNI